MNDAALNELATRVGQLEAREMAAAKERADWYGIESTAFQKHFELVGRDIHALQEAFLELLKHHNELLHDFNEVAECLHLQGLHIYLKALDEAKGRQPRELRHIDVVIDPLPTRFERRANSEVT